MLSKSDLFSHDVQEDCEYYFKTIAQLKALYNKSTDAHYRFYTDFNDDDRSKIRAMLISVDKALIEVKKQIKEMGFSDQDTYGHTFVPCELEKTFKGLVDAK